MHWHRPGTPKEETALLKKIMRKQSWQVRLIPLFYSVGIIKGLSNNNYAPKVDTLLSCSRCEWQ